MSQWLYLQLKEHVDELLICNPTYVAKKSGAKTDFRDALQTAENSFYKNIERVDDSFMWVRGSPEQGIVLFDYDISGGGKLELLLVFGGSDIKITYLEIIKM